MCRNIRKLRQPDRLPTGDELHDASERLGNAIARLDGSLKEGGVD